MRMRRRKSPNICKLRCTLLNSLWVKRNLWCLKRTLKNKNFLKILFNDNSPQIDLYVQCCPYHNPSTHFFGVEIDKLILKLYGISKPENSPTKI